jgi:hypothetical protein
LENRESVDQTRNKALRFLAEHAAALSRQGSVQRTWRSHRGRRLGPYFSLVFRVEGGRLCSRYLGTDEALAEEVRVALREMQAPLRQGRELDRQLGRILAELRQAKRALDGELAQMGLHRQGSEVRGWRLRQAARCQAARCQAGRPEGARAEGARP